MPSVLGDIAELKQRRIQCLNIGDDTYVLLFLNDRFHLLDNLCPHKGASLCEGEVKSGQLVCPWHKAHFDIHTGGSSSPLARDGVNAYPLIVENHQLLVKFN